MPARPNADGTYGLPPKRHSYVEPMPMPPKHHYIHPPVATMKHHPPNYAHTEQHPKPERLSSHNHQGGGRRRRHRHRHYYAPSYAYYPRPFGHVYDNYGYYGANGYDTAGIAALALARAAAGRHRYRPASYYYGGMPIRRYFSGGAASDEQSACPGCGRM